MNRGVRESEGVVERGWQIRKKKRKEGDRERERERGKGITMADVGQCET